MTEQRWQPLSEVELHDRLNQAWMRMNNPQRWLWEVIRCEPRKWQLHPWGDKGGGFWVVGLAGMSVVWFNDIEDGFNRSSYSRLGTIDEYWCNQGSLEPVVEEIRYQIEAGAFAGARMGPPIPGQFSG